MHIIKICQGGSCRRNFVEETLKKAESLLGIKAGEQTADGKIRLETCGCLSNCDYGPNVFIGTQDQSPLSLIMGDGKVENHMTPRNIEARIRELQGSPSNQNPNNTRLPNL